MPPESRETILDTLFPRRALRLRQRAFAEARRDVVQSDDDFLREACDGCPAGQRRFVLELRARLANCCGCESRCIRAGDSTAELHPVMGETSFLGWFITLGDLGPEETFFFGLELLYEEAGGKPARFDFEAQHALRDMWVAGCPLGSWIRAVWEGLEQGSRGDPPSKVPLRR